MNKNSHRRILPIFALLCVLVIPLPLLSQAAPAATEKGSSVPADKAKAIVQRARDSYYSLHSKGLAGFRCAVLPDWDGMFSSIKTDDVAREQLLPILKATKFELLVGPDGASTVSHNSDIVPPAEAVAARLRQSISGVDQILTGFMHTWSGFVINTVFPEPGGVYQLQETNSGYVLEYGQGEQIRVTVKLTDDLHIAELSVMAPQFSGNVRPTFTDKNGLLLLDGYSADYAASGAKNVQQLSVNVSYQEVNEFMLPSNLKATVETPGGPLQLVMVFTDCTTSK